MLKFAKTIVIYQINPFKFIKVQSCIQNKKSPRFGTKNTLFRHFWVAILEIHCRKNGKVCLKWK